MATLRRWDFRRSVKQAETKPRVGTRTAQARRARIQAFRAVRVGSGVEGRLELLATPDLETHSTHKRLSEDLGAV